MYVCMYGRMYVCNVIFVHLMYSSKLTTCIQLGLQIERDLNEKVSALFTTYSKRLSILCTYVRCMLLFLCSLKQCQTVALHTLIRLINQNEIFKDVFREVGLLEVLISSLRKFSDRMKEVYGGKFFSYAFYLALKGGLRTLRSHAYQALPYLSSLCDHIS